MRVLIFGADGFLGANLAKLMIERGHEATGTALNRKGATSLDALDVKCRVEYGDVTDPSFVERVINSTEAQIVYHLAAVSIVRKAAANPALCLRTNIMGTVNVLDACAKAGHVEACVVASSDKAYGDHDGHAYGEEDELKPTGAYEVSKACADLIARTYPGGDCRMMVTRCGNLYGPGDLNWSRLVPNSIRNAVNGKPPVVHADAWDYRREWLYVQDACTAYALIADKGTGGEAYNVGSGFTMTAGDMATSIAMLMGSPMPVTGGSLRCSEIPEQALDCTKIRDLGWNPVPSFNLRLAETIQWYSHYLQPYLRDQEKQQAEIMRLELRAIKHEMGTPG